MEGRVVKFVYAPDAQAAAVHLAERLVQELQASKRVLWLTCGGSNIPLAVTAMQSIPAELQGNLTVALTDERYGEVGHRDSNWQQLNSAGFTSGNARIIPTLQAGLSLADTCEAYARTIAEAFAANDVIIAQFGIGPDGHIAGILPDSLAVTDEILVVGYETEQFTRITLTPPALRHITAAFAFVYGESKLAALQNLQTDLPLAKEPAQILKELPEAYIYTDQIKGER